MARFKKIKIDPEDTDARIIQKIRNQMMISQSIELVAVVSQSGLAQLEVRAWNGIRKDESNSADASGTKEY